MKMSASSTNGPKKQRRDAAREHAKALREQAAKKKRRNRWFLQGGLAIGALAVLAVVVLVVVNVAKPPGPGPKNMLSDGILLSGPGMAPVATPALAPGEAPVATKPSAHPSTVNIVTYIDYQCPYCQQFEATNGAQIQQWVQDGFATIEIHPIAILDSSSQGTRYSTRAANAAACVANYQPSVFYAVNTALFAAQPKEQTSGLTDQKLIAVVQGAGATNTSIPKCITSQQFAGWVSAATSRVLKGPLPNSTVSALNGTPTVIVHGKTYTGSLTDPKAFAQFVDTAGIG